MSSHQLASIPLISPGKSDRGEKGNPELEFGASLSLFLRDMHHSLQLGDRHPVT